MPIVRVIYVTVKTDQVKDAINLWKNHCAPLMIKQPGCLSEKLLECIDAPGEFISYSEWDTQASIDRYRDSEAHGARVGLLLPHDFRVDDDTIGFAKRGRGGRPL